MDSNRQVALTSFRRFMILTQLDTLRHRASYMESPSINKVDEFGMEREKSEITINT